jgi:hypothetical protein
MVLMVVVLRPVPPSYISSHVAPRYTLLIIPVSVMDSICCEEQQHKVMSIAVLFISVVSLALRGVISSTLLRNRHLLLVI